MLTIAIALAAIALGYWLQSKFESTAAICVGALLVTGAATLLAPTLLGIPTLYAFGVAFGVAFGAHIVYKAKLRAWARSYRRSH
ncbi:MAG: hypothetical protein K2Y39_04790 [Candidatus Obscuribacterales bacterium]|nr:hypothetical protein [Candidatus Obscuribacterales bacterium]